MILSLLLGIAGGFILAIPPGPISLAAMRQVLAGFFKNGLFIVIAAALMDMVYMLIATFASSALVATAHQIMSGSAYFALGFQIVCVVILLYLGISFLVPERREHKEQIIKERELAQERRAQTMGHTSPFFVGFLMAVTNLASPTFLPSLIAVVGFFQANGYLPRAIGDSFLFSIGFGTGTLLWLVVAMRMLSHFRSRLPESFINGIYRFAAGTMLLFAAIIAFHVVTATPWHALFH